MSNMALWEWVSHALRLCAAGLANAWVDIVRFSVSERNRRLAISRNSSAASLWGSAKIPQTSPSQPSVSVNARPMTNARGVFAAARKV